MKYLFLVLGFLFCSASLKAQDIIGSVKRGPYLIAELSIKARDTTNFYKLRFLDPSSEILKSIEFHCSEKQLEELYIFFKDMLTKKNGTSNNIQVGKYTFNVTTQKMMGLRNLAIQINEDYHFGLNGKEIDKLMNKNTNE